MPEFEFHVPYEQYDRWVVEADNIEEAYEMARKMPPTETVISDCVELRWEDVLAFDENGDQIEDFNEWRK